MKIAVCYSGFIRIFKDLIDNHIEYLLSNFDCDVFLDTWNVYGNGGHTLKYESSENDTITNFDIENIVSKINPINYNFEDYFNMEKFFIENEKKYYEGYPYVRNILSMFYKIKSCNDMMLKQNKKYDLVLRLRCDHKFISNVEFDILSENTLYTNGLNMWSDNVVNDQFFYGKQDVMNKATNVYSRLDSLFKDGYIKQSPEYLFFLSLKQENILINKKQINYYQLIRSKEQQYH